MLQVRDVTNVWADWLIYGVRYDSQRRHIQQLFAYADTGGALNQTESFTREAVIRAIELGSTFETTYLDPVARKYNRGARVIVVNLHGSKYLKTVADGTPYDNLGRLPEI